MVPGFQKNSLICQFTLIIMDSGRLDDKDLMTMLSLESWLFLLKEICKNIKVQSL